MASQVNWIVECFFCITSARGTKGFLLDSHGVGPVAKPCIPWGAGRDQRIQLWDPNSVTRSIRLCASQLSKGVEVFPNVRCYVLWELTCTKNCSIQVTEPIGQKHPAGSKTVLMKIEFYKKMCVLPQRGNHLCHLKSGKFGRPNLGVFWGNCVSLQLNTIFFSISIGQIQASFFSLDLSQHLCSLLKQLLVLIDEAPLPHFGI